MELACFRFTGVRNEGAACLFGQCGWPLLKRNKILTIKNIRLRPSPFIWDDFIMLVGLLINILIVGLIFGLLWWVLTMLPLPAPFSLIIRVVMTVILIIILIEDVLLPLAGGGFGQVHLLSTH